MQNFVLYTELENNVSSKPTTGQNFLFDYLQSFQILIWNLFIRMKIWTPIIF